MFFALSKPEGKRTARGKKGRASKGSRLSTQSNLTTASEDIPMIDVNMNGDYTMSAQEPEIVAPSKATKGAKNGTRGKKAAPKSGRKVSTIQQEEIVPGSSFAEPEDDDFEVKVEQKPSQKTTGMKRKSDDMSLDEDLVQAGMHHGHPQSQEPPTKRRATRTCVPGPNAASDPELGTGQHDDSLMTDLESMPAPPPPVSRKTTKGGKRKASSSTRKASATSTASKASLRAAIPDDEEIDAALEADLNRPLTDDEVELEPALIPKGKTRRLTRTRPGSRHVTASTAPVRRTTHASALPVEGDSMTSIDASAKDSQVEAAEQPKAVEIALTAMDHAKQEIIAETDKHIASKAKTRGRPRSTSTKAAKKGKGAREDNLEDKDSESIPHKSSISVEAPQMSEGQQESDQLPETSTRMSGGSVGSLKDEKAVQLDSSTLAPGEALKSSDVEMQDSQANQSRAKKGGKQRSAAAKKLRPNKRGAANNPNNEETVQVEAGDVGRGEPVVVVELTSPDDEQDIGERTLPVETPIKDGPGGKGKGKKPKKRTAAKSKKRDTLPPSEACAVSQVEPGELPSIAARKQDTTTEIPTPADSQGQDDGHKVSVRFPTPPVQATSAQQTPKTVNSPQSSDAENQPPSARPSALRPPLLVQTPSKSQTARVPLAATTPTASPWKRNISRLQTSLPWTSIDIERIFNSPAADKENVPGGGIADSEKGLSSPEKKLTVEEWIRWNAKRGEEKLREDCERLVGKFEGEGVRALKTLEGIVCAD